MSKHKQIQYFSRLRIRAVCSILAGVVSLPCSLVADNQIVPGNTGTSDPAPMVENGTVYLYSTVDAIGNGDLSIYDISCHSTTDLYHWKDEGIALTENNIPWAAKIGNLWAPHCIKLGGKFHLYFPANDGRTFRIGHAVADSPTGPFVADRNYMAGCGSNAIDPFVILDTADNGSGKAYIAWNIVGRTPNEVYIKELNSTFDDAIGTQHDITSGLGSATRYKEGIWIIEQNNTWYCFIADWTGSVESITYSTSSSLFGPYTKQGTVMNMNTNSATIHCGIVNFLDQWIMFYHTGGNEFGGTINTGTKRVVGTEYMYFDKSVSPWSVPVIAKTYRGTGTPFSYDTIQIDRHSPSGISGARISVVGGGEPRGWMVSNITNNGYVRYNDVNFANTDKSSGEIRARVAGVNAGGLIEVRIGSQTGTLLGTIDVPSTGGLTSWQTVTAPVSLEGLALTGTEDLILLFKTTAFNQFNINWISIGEEHSTKVSQTEIKPISKPVSIYRTNKNSFQVSFPDMAGVARISVFNMKGQKVTGIISPVSSDSRTLTIGLKGTLSGGMYLLSIKREKSKIQIPFVY